MSRYWKPFYSSGFWLEIQYVVGISREDNTMFCVKVYRFANKTAGQTEKSWILVCQVFRKNSLSLSVYFLFLFELELPPPLITHHSIEKWCLGDRALGEGMYQEFITKVILQTVRSFSKSRTESRSFILPITTSVVLLSVREISHMLHTNTHKQTHTLWPQPLINPAFPCGRSLEGDAGGQIEASSLPLLMKQCYYCGWNNLPKSRGCGEENTS